jgi:Fic family protein
MSSGTYEFDDRGRKFFRPNVPLFPALDEVRDLLDPAMASLREFDRRLGACKRDAAVGRLFARLDAVHSSAAEGSTTTFTDLMEYETSLRIAPNVDDASAVAAVAYAFQESAGDGLEGLILRLHGRLFQHARDKMVAAGAGKLKVVPNFVRDSEFSEGFFGYTSPASLSDAMRDWCEFTMAVEPRTAELLRQLLSHWMFEQIHPFPDGNGRIGRLLVPIIMRLKGQTVMACTFLGEAVHFEKELYVEALKDARSTGKMSNYIRQMLSFIRTTAQANLERLDKLQALENEWKARFANIKSDSVVHRLVEYAVTKPVFTVNDAQAQLGVSYAAANTAAHTLTNAGILFVPEDVRRDRLFHVEEVLGIFDGVRLQRSGRPPSSKSGGVS